MRRVLSSTKWCLIFKMLLGFGESFHRQCTIIAIIERLLSSRRAAWQSVRRLWQLSAWACRDVQNMDGAGSKLISDYWKVKGDHRPGACSSKRVRFARVGNICRSPGSGTPDDGQISASLLLVSSRSALASPQSGAIRHGCNFSGTPGGWSPAGRVGKRMNQRQWNVRAQPEAA